MAPYVAEILKDFCGQNEEFAQAVVQGGSFNECMGAVVKAIKKEAISDLDACKAAAKFYFPGCVVEFHMSIHMSKYEAEEAQGMDAEKLRSAAETAKAEGKKEVQADMDKANAERAAAVAGKAEAEARAEGLERRLKLADSSTAVFQVYFTAVQEDCNRMMGLIKKAEPEQAEKFRKAMTALLGSVGNMLNT